MRTPSSNTIARAYLPKRNAANTLSIPEKNNYDIWILSQLLTSLSLLLLSKGTLVQVVFDAQAVLGEKRKKSSGTKV